MANERMPPPNIDEWDDDDIVYLLRHGHLMSHPYNLIRRIAANRIEELKEYRSALIGMVYQHCSHKRGDLDSGYLSANAEALEVLIEDGVLEKVCGSGRMIIARENPERHNFQKGKDWNQFTKGDDKC